MYAVQANTTKKLLPEWVQGPNKRPFIGNMDEVTVYFSMPSQFSEYPRIALTIAAASCFDAVRIIIPDTLNAHTAPYLESYKGLDKPAILAKLKDEGSQWYERNKSHFQLLIQKIQQTFNIDTFEKAKKYWEENFKKHWDDYKNQPACSEAEGVIQQVLAHEEKELSQGKHTLTAAVYDTLQGRLNVIHDTKKQTYEINTEIAQATKQYLIEELAQLLVHALELKQRHGEKINNVGHGILYAQKLNPAMYKLFQLLKSPNENKSQSIVNKLLSSYKIPSNIMQPLKINWELSSAQQFLLNADTMLASLLNKNSLIKQAANVGYAPTLYKPVTKPMVKTKTSPRGDNSSISIKRSSPPKEDLLTVAETTAKLVTTQNIPIDQAAQIAAATYYWLQNYHEQSSDEEMIELVEETIENDHLTGQIFPSNSIVNQP